MERSRRERLKREFVESVSHLIELNKFEGTSIFKFLKHYAQKFNNPHIPLDEVLIEGVKRGTEWIDKNGKPIECPEAWLRVTCLNVLRDKVKDVVREERKSENLSLVTILQNEPRPKPELIEQLEYLDMAMQRLSEDDRMLISLRFFEAKKYKQIQAYFFRLYGTDISVPALRKRESRAMERLRNHFFYLYEKGVSHSS